MSHASKPPPSGWTPPFRAGLALLLQGRRYARETGRPPAAFPVELDLLKQAGLTTNDVRWLVERGLVEPVAATAGRRGPRRRPAGFILDGQPAFVLTDSGAAVARHLGVAADPAGVVAADARPMPGAPGDPGAMRPHYDELARALCLGDHVCKSFHQPAPKQVLVMRAFEEQGWQPVIDDPLPPDPGQDPKQHLHMTLGNLNRGQSPPWVHFAGDGTGEHIRWEIRRDDPIR